MRNVLSIFVMLTMCIVCFSACTSGESSPASKEPAGQVSLTFAHAGSTLDAEVNKARIDLFNSQNPDIKVEAMRLTDDFIQKYITMFASGTAPDVLWFAEDIHSFSSKGQLIPLNDYIEKAGFDPTERNMEAYVKMYTYDGNIYGLQDRGGSMVVYYNKTMFDEAGVAYPNADWTWADMLSAAKAMTKGEGDSEQWGFGLEYWFPYWMNWCYQNGGSVVDEAGNVVLNSPENIEAITFMQELSTVHDVIPTRVELADFGAGATAGTIFAQGRMGMMMNGLWSVASLQEADFDWDIVEMWKQKEAVTCPFGSVLSISSTSENPDEAFRFLNFMNDVDSQKIIVDKKQDAPANLDVLGSPEFVNAEWTGKPIDLGVFNRQAVFSLPLGPKFTEWNVIWSDGFAGVFDGTVAPATALSDMEAQMKK